MKKTVIKTLEEIKETLLQYNKEEREQILHEEIDRETIYYNDCFNIVNDARPVSFYNEITGEYCKDINELAWYILYAAFTESERYSNLIY